MYNYKENYRRLPLKNVHNLRDLGGYAAEEYSITKWHCYLRSDNVYNITDSEKEFLKGYGLTTVIDLRSPDEVKDKPNPFMNDKGVGYHNIPLLSMDMSEIISKANAKEMKTFKLGDLYKAIAENSQAELRRVFGVFLEESSVCTLYHCTAGKDRTGVISALLLSMVGVELEDIMADYEVTNTHLRKIYRNIKHIAPEIPISMIESAPINIEEFINHINENYGGAVEYLLNIGLTSSEIGKLKTKFLYRI